MMVEVGMSKIFWSKDSLHVCNTHVDYFPTPVGVCLYEACMGYAEPIMEAGETEGMAAIR